MFNIMSENSQTQSAWKKVKQVGGGYYWENETTGEKKYGSESPSEREKQANQTDASTKVVQQVNLLDMPVRNENEALNVMVGFLGLAQKRGCWAINESAKIYECVQMFQKTDVNN